MDAKDKIIFELRNIIVCLEKRIDDLEAEVHWVKTSKNSGNSSLPPSSNFGKPAQKPNQNLRKGSDRKTGD
jgi:hypothetical protein